MVLRQGKCNIKIEKYPKNKEKIIGKIIIPLFTIQACMQIIREKSLKMK